MDGSARQLQRGYVLLGALFVISMIAAYINVLMMRTLTENQAARRYTDRMQTFHIAEAVLDDAHSQFRNRLSVITGFPLEDELPDIQPASYPGYMTSLQIDYPTVEMVDTFTTDNPDDPLLGLQALKQRVSFQATVTSQTTGTPVTLRWEILAQLVPIFQFAIFDNYDHALVSQSQVNGRIHTNGSLTLMQLVQLLINGRVTTGGALLHDNPLFWWSSSYTGDVLIHRPTDGTYQNMKNGDGTWLDTNHPDWPDPTLGATARWGGAVAAGVAPLGLPLPDKLPVEDPNRNIELIKMPNAADPYDEIRLYHQAGLRIIDGTMTKADGTMVIPADNPISSTQFWDTREGWNGEGKLVSVMDIDVSKLTGEACPANGVLYVGDTSNPTNDKVVRLINGETLPTTSTPGCGENGLTVVTHHPLYVKGDYNKVGKQPAALIADSVTVLSDGFTDPQMPTDFTDRQATDTTLNAAVMTSSVPDIGAKLFTLENWGGTDFTTSADDATFTFNGSITALWRSEETEDFSDVADESDISQRAWIWEDDRCLAAFSPTQCSYYPGIRIWNFDPDLLDSTRLPHATPHIYRSHTLIWEEL